MFSALIVALVIGMTLIAYLTKRATIGFLASASWLLQAAYHFNQSTATWDMEYLLAWFSIGAFIAVALESSFMRFGIEGRDKVQELPEDKDPKERKTSQPREYESGIDQLRREHNMPPSREIDNRRTARALRRVR